MLPDKRAVVRRSHPDSSSLAPRPASKRPSRSSPVTWNTSVAASAVAAAPLSADAAAFRALVMRLHTTLWAFQSSRWCSFEQYPRVLHDAQSLVAFISHDGSPHSSVEEPSAASALPDMMYCNRCCSVEVTRKPA